MTKTTHADTLHRIGSAARSASQHMSTLSTAIKNQWLITCAALLRQSQQALRQANDQDIKAAQAKQKSAAFIDRLTLSDTAIENLALQLEALVNLPDPVGSIDHLTNQPSGIQVGKMRVPIGVIAMIYEARPNVTVEASALAIKSGNAIVLRGGSDAIHSNTALAQLLQAGAEQCQLPEKCIQLVTILDHDFVINILQATQFIDVVIPRGGKALVQLIQEKACVPVIKHLDGICHTYIDEHADLEKAIAIADNAKTQRYGTCNTMETLLVHAAIAQPLLARLLKIYQDKGVELRLCPRSLAIAQALDIVAQAATDEDWATEYLAPIISIKIVDSFAESLAHIQQYGSQHTEVIVTENHALGQSFLRAVDASSVMINASSRFADGFEYGLGAEIGISTNKLHVRGPVGLEGLTTQKYIVLGDGHIRG